MKKIKKIERYSIEHIELLEKLGLKDFEIEYLTNNPVKKTIEFEISKRKV